MCLLDPSRKALGGMRQIGVAVGRDGDLGGLEKSSQKCKTKRGTSSNRYKVCGRRMCVVLARRSVVCVLSRSEGAFVFLATRENRGGTQNCCCPVAGGQAATPPKRRARRTCLPHRLDLANSSAATPARLLSLH